MNYRHIYHAGNFADVFKHWILTLLLQKLQEKPTPFFILDTHAGIGSYDLRHEAAQKTLEHTTGIYELLKQNLEPEFLEYMKIVASINSKGAAELYPGSPYICQHNLREGDRLVLSELHPSDFDILKENFGGDKQITIFKQDGYATMKALLPPKEKRGLIFIDPPFENPDEFNNIVGALDEGIKRFAHGMYAVWYPIKDRKLVKKFYSQVSKLPISKSLVIEIHANEAILNLSSCGMLVINPPWQLDEKLRANLPKLIDYLGFKNGNYLVTSL